MCGWKNILAAAITEDMVIDSVLTSTSVAFLSLTYQGKGHATIQSTASKRARNSSTISGAIT